MQTKELNFYRLECFKRFKQLFGLKATLAHFYKKVKGMFLKMILFLDLEDSELVLKQKITNKTFYSVSFVIL